jgi:hypothetical protein
VKTTCLILISTDFEDLICVNNISNQNIIGMINLNTK